MLAASNAIGRDTNASINDTTGWAVDLRRATRKPFTVKQIKVYVSALAFIGFSRGDSSAGTPPSPTSGNTVYQEAGTEEVYSTNARYLYIYAATGTITARVSLFG